MIMKISVSAEMTLSTMTMTISKRETVSTLPKRNESALASSLPELMMVIKRPTLRHISWVLGGSLLLCGLFWLWLTVQQQESTLAIRPVSQGISMPDGFSVWHHLDANGIRFKSITPQNDGLLIKFDSSAQGAAAKED